jgi:hypothetical protein
MHMKHSMNNRNLFRDSHPFIFLKPAGSFFFTAKKLLMTGLCYAMAI